MAPDLASLLRLLKRPDVALLVPVGSRVYGTARPDSDHDFLAVVESGRDDLLYAPDVNVTVKARASFEQALRDHSMFAMEAHFAPTRLVEGSFPFKLDRRALWSAVEKKSAEDFAKAEKRYDEEPTAMAKKLFHSVRVVDFGVQLCERGRLEDFMVSAPVWAAVSAQIGADWAELCAAVAPSREARLERLRGLCR
jgi:predicted nucleotidyltransferase